MDNLDVSASENVYSILEDLANEVELPENHEVASMAVAPAETKKVTCGWKPLVQRLLRVDKHRKATRERSRFESVDDEMFARELATFASTSVEADATTTLVEGAIVKISGDCKSENSPIVLDEGFLGTVRQYSTDCSNALVYLPEAHTYHLGEHWVSLDSFQLLHRVPTLYDKQRDREMEDTEVTFGLDQTSNTLIEISKKAKRRARKTANQSK